MILLAHSAVLSLKLRTGYDSIEPRHSVLISLTTSLWREEIFVSQPHRFARFIWAGLITIGLSTTLGMFRQGTAARATASSPAGSPSQHTGIRAPQPAHTIYLATIMRPLTPTGIVTTPAQ